MSRRPASGSGVVPLRVQVQGSGEPLVLLHGLFGSGRNWASVARRLGERFRVWSVDLRNHGASPHRETMDYPLMASDLQAMLESEGLGAATLVGHSMGGKVAMVTALRVPERISRLAVVDIAPVRYAHDHDELVAALLAVDLAAAGTRAAVDAALREQVPDTGLRQFLLTNLVSTDGALRWRVNLAAIRDSMAALTGYPKPAPDARPYTGPSVFLRGEHSQYILPEHHEAIRRWFPAAEVRTVEGAGHWVHAEQPARFLAELEAFLGA